MNQGLVTYSFPFHSLRVQFSNIDRISRSMTLRSCVLVDLNPNNRAASVTTSFVAAPRWTSTMAKTALRISTGGIISGLHSVAIPSGMAEGDTIELLFPYTTGKQLDPSWFRRNPWRKVFEKADIPQIRLHDMRHTFASLLLQQGESLHYVKDQLGHASIQTTVDVYGHLAPGSNRNAVNQLDDDETPPLRIVSAAG